MNIENVDLEYFVDYTNKKIHIKEISNSYFHSLLNVIASQDFKEKLIMEEHLLIDVIDFEWICYSSKGLIMAYKGHEMTFVSKDSDWLHKPFTG